MSLPLLPFFLYVFDKVQQEALEKVDWGETVFLNPYFKCWKREILSRQRQKKTFAAIAHDKLFSYDDAHTDTTFPSVI